MPLKSITGGADWINKHSLRHHGRKKCINLKACKWVMNCCNVEILKSHPRLTFDYCVDYLGM